MSDFILDGIEIPEDLQWSDEFIGWKVGQSVRYSLNGAMHVHENARQAGRPITLVSRQEGNDYIAMVRLDTLTLLQAHEAQARTLPFVLQMAAPNTGTRSFNVHWRRTDGAAIEATPMVDIVPYVSGDWFAVTLRLMSAD